MAAMNAEEAIERIRTYFTCRDEFRLVIVFGSAAKGHFRADSDVDIAVAAHGTLDRELLLSTKSELSALLDRPVDLVDLAAVEGLIVREAVTSGIRVKTDPELFVKFHTKVMTYREDFLPLKRAMVDARIERFIDGQGRTRNQA